MWTQAFRDHLHRWISMRNVPLAYVIMEYVYVPADGPTLIFGQLYSIGLKSIEGDIINIDSQNPWDIQV